MTTPFRPNPGDVPPVGPVKFVGNCPFQPKTRDREKLYGPGGVELPPLTACETDRCACYLQSIDNRTGKIVGGACAFAMIGTGLAQIAQLLSQFTVNMKAGAPMQVPPPAKPD